MAASITFRFSSLLLSNCKIFKIKFARCINSTTTGFPETSTEKDPFPIFVDKKVQDLLFRITKFDYLKVAGPQKKQLNSPVYKLLTDEEMKKEIEAAQERLKYRMQIPPFMNPRKPPGAPLLVDPDLAGFDKSSYVFVDVSFGVKDRQRNVVIRRPDGSLSIASWDVKERMNQIFNPREGKEYFKPKMFEEQNLEKLISQKKYLYILDRSCCQFEPDDPDYIRTTRRVFNAINKTQNFHLLRSTRHFGSLAFYLAWNAMIDDLLLDMINQNMLSDAYDLINLFCIIHPSSSCAQELSKLSPPVDPENTIKIYTQTESKKKTELELSLQAAVDNTRNQEKQKSQA